MPFPERLPIPAEVVELARQLEAAGFEAWCVGGAVRDALLGDPNADYDLATSAMPDEVRALFPRTVPVGLKYGTIGVLDRRRVLHEVTTFRRDVATDGRHATVAYGVSLEDDLARRDFTINAIAYHPLRHEWRDPFDGAGDLRRRVVRAVGVAADRFREDYLRILRGLRFAARFGLAIDPVTWEAACQAAPGLAHLSAERIREEWYKGLRTAGSVVTLAHRWIDVGAARAGLPELEAGPVGNYLEDPAAAAPPRDPVVLTAWLCAAATPAVLRRLKASSADIARAAAMTAPPPAPGIAGAAVEAGAGNRPTAVDESGVADAADATGVAGTADTGAKDTTRAPAIPAGAPAPDVVEVRRWLAAVGTAADDLICLWALRHGTPPAWAETVRQVRERGEPIARSDLAVTGRDLQALGLAGPRIGEMLAVLLDRVHTEPSLNTREALLDLAARLRSVRRPG